MPRKRDPYFNNSNERPVTFWASAVRSQLGRWDPLVAKHTKMVLERNLASPPAVPTVMEPDEYWRGEMERHFLLIAIGHLLQAIDLMDNPPRVEPIVRSEVKEARDLNEHWVENMPVFMVTPRQRGPGYRSGKDFANRNPQAGPYNWWSWNGQDGPMVTPHVSEVQVRSLVDAALAATSGGPNDMTAYIVEAPPMRWIEPKSADDWWWPDPETH